MLDKIRDNVAILALFLILGGFVAYGIYSPTNGSEKADALRLATVQGCEQGKSQALIFAQFANEAAAARRRSAEKAQEGGDKILALNEIATAKRYEGYAKRYVDLAPQNCQRAYP